MKKFLIVSLCVVLFLTMFAVTFFYVADRNSVQQKTEIDITAYVPAKNKNAIQTKSSELSTVHPYENDEEKFQVENSSVIYGEVLNTNYVLNGSTVFTKSEVKVIKCYKGQFETDEVICVKELGGFVPSDVMSNAISMEKFGVEARDTNENVELLDIRAENFKVMEQGEKVILFIVPVTSTDNEAFENCYELIRLWQGKLLYEEELGAFIPYCPAWDLDKDNKADSSASVKVKSTGECDGGVQARAYTLSEFEFFAQQIMDK